MGLAQMRTNADKGRGFDCMWTSATQYHTACRAGVQLHTFLITPTVTVQLWLY